LGYCLQKYGQKLYAMLVMSNHYHADMMDTDGTLPEFKSTFHGLLGRGINCYRGRSDTFWSGDGGCDTRQPTEEETLSDLVYTLTNATKAKLVKTGSRWPGFSTCGWRFGEVRRFGKPTWFFDENNSDMPDIIEVRLSRPPIFLELSDDELYEKLMECVYAREREIQREVKAKSQRFMGERKLRKQKWNSPPRSRPDRFTVTPKVVASSKWARLAQLQRDRDWEHEYAEARQRHGQGSDVVFPAGTYWMRRYMGVRVATAPR
jgi:putative transposase